MTEKEYQKRVIDLLHALGYRVLFIYKVFADGRWRTTIGADGKGYVDVTAWRERDKRRVYIECKSDTGRQSPEQKEWQRFLESMGEEFYLTRPKDYDILADRLR